MFYPPPSNELEINSNLVSEVVIEETDVETLTPSTITTKSLNEQIVYKRYHLQQIAEWVLNDYDLIRNNLTNKTVNNNDLTFSVSQLINSIETSEKQVRESKLITAVNAFKNIDGESWYPRLRFLNAKDITSRTAGDNPLTVVEDASDQGQMFTGYELDENNELYPIDETPTQENTANRNLVIIELGDTDCDGNQKCNTGGGGDTGGGDTGGGDTGGGGNSASSASIKQMTIKDLKESWPARPEIHFKGFSVLNLPQQDGECGTRLSGSSSCSDHLGKRIKQIKRSDKNDQFNANYVVDDGLFTNVPQFVMFTIFEKDNFPAPRKESEFGFPNGVEGEFKYRSWESAYDEQLLNTQNNAFGLEGIFGFATENSDIKYNIDFTN